MARRKIGGGAVKLPCRAPTPKGHTDGRENHLVLVTAGECQSQFHADEDRGLGWGCSPVRERDVHDDLAVSKW